MSARTYRARGVILLLVSILGVGLATIWARSLQPVASDLQRVDSLLSLLQQMRLLWEYQFVLTRQIDGSLDWLATQGGSTDDRATVFKAVFGVDEERTDGTNTVDNAARVRNGIWRFGRTSTDAASTLPETLPAAESASATAATDASALRSAWQGLMTQQIHPEDLGYTGEFLPCAVDPPTPPPGEDSPDAQLCWQVKATPGNRPTLHFWVNVGNSEDLRELLWRLRTSDWSQSATFCPMRESEMGDALTDVDLDFADDGTVICPSSDTVLADRNLLGLDEVEADMTVLLGRWVVGREQANTGQVYTYQKPEDGKPYESLVLPPEIFLHNLDEISAYRLYPTFLHPGRSAASILANPHPFGVGSDYRSEGSEAVIRVQPFASDEELPYATNLEPHQRCYELFARKPDSADAAGAQKVDNVWLPALPLKCNTQTMFGGSPDPLNRLGDHPRHITDFGFADTAHRYPPQLTFAAAPMGRGKSGFAGAPTVRGSIMAKWLYIRHLMGSVFLAPNIGPRPKNANDALDFTNELAWPGMGGGCLSKDKDSNELLDDCSYLTVAADTVVFSEAIVAMGTVKTTARVPSQGPIWSQGPELALESIRPYRYELSDGKPAIGFLAQEVKSVYPQAVQRAGDSLALGYYSLLPVLHRQLREIRRQHRDSIGQHRDSIEQNRDSIEQNQDSIEALQTRLAFLQGQG